MKAFGCGIVLLVVVFLLMCAGIVLPFSVLIHSVFGWILFLTRSSREMTVNWSAIATLGTAAVAFVVGSHLLVRRVFRGPQPESPRWRWRWTVGGFAIVLVMFVAGTAIVGLAHQLVWLASAREPLVDRRFEAAERTQSHINLQSIGLAMHNYHDEFDSFPSGATFNGAGVPQHSWQTRLLPYVDQAPLYKTIDLAEAWNSPANRTPFNVTLHVYLNPGFRSQQDGPYQGDHGYALSHYAANAYVIGGGFGLALGDIPDGAANTLLAGEVAGRFRPWGDPLNWRDPALGINRDPAGFGSPFTGGANVLIGDGRVTFVSEKIDPAVLEALATPAGGEPPTEF